MYPAVIYQHLLKLHLANLIFEKLTANNLVRLHVENSLVIKLIDWMCDCFIGCRAQLLNTKAVLTIFLACTTNWLKMKPGIFHLSRGCLGENRTMAEISSNEFVDGITSVFPVQHKFQQFSLAI